MKRAHPSLRHYLDTTGETQQQLAARLGISQSYLSRIVNGRLEPPLALALRIAKLVNVPLESLVTAEACDSVNG